MAKVELIVMGVSAGASETLSQLLANLPFLLSIPCVVVQHLHPWQDHVWLQEYQTICPLSVKEAEDKEPIQANFIYFAPPNYHLMINDDKTFALSIDPKVNFSRPSIDVLFESAVDVYGKAVAGIILTGGSQDGTAGLRAIHANGGLTMVQDPETAIVSLMPSSALDAVPTALVGSIAMLNQQLEQLVT